MSLELKRQLVAQLVESSRLLRHSIDNRRLARHPTKAIEASLARSSEIKRRIKGLARQPGSIAAGC